MTEILPLLLLTSHKYTMCIVHAESPKKAVLRSRNYLFSAPTPAAPLSIISAPAQAPVPAPALAPPMELEVTFSSSQHPPNLLQKIFTKQIISAPAPGLT